MIISVLLLVIAGFLIPAGLALNAWVHPYYYFFTAFIGVNLLQTGLTKFCPLAIILKNRAFLKPGIEAPRGR